MWKRNVHPDDDARHAALQECAGGLFAVIPATLSSQEKGRCEHGHFFAV